MHCQLCAKLVLPALHVLSHLIFSINLGGLVILSLHSTGEKTGPQRQQVCPTS